MLRSSNRSRCCNLPIMKLPALILPLVSFTFALADDLRPAAIPRRLPKALPYNDIAAIIACRMSFHVCGLLITSFGNMQPSQQMCLMPREAASLSQ